MRETKPEKAIQMAARMGLLARAAVYFLVGGLAVWAVTLGNGDTDRGPAEAFRSLNDAPFGTALVLLIAIGLVLYAAWRLVQGVMDTERAGTGAKARLARLGMAVSGLSYGTLAIAAFAMLAGRGNGGGDGVETFSRRVLELPLALGVVLLAASGLIFAAIGSAQIWRAWTRQFEKGLARCEATRRLAPVCMAGIGGRGVLFILIGLFLLYAAEDADPDEAMGAAELMGWLREQFFGLPLYLAAAFALLAYAVYSVIQARYRWIGTDV